MSKKNRSGIIKVQKKNKTEIPPNKNENKEITPKWLIAIIVFTALLYSKAIYFDFVSYDDIGYVTNNPYLRDFSWKGVSAIFTHFYYGNYHPFTSILYLLEYTLFGLNPLPFHLLSILIHLLNIWLVFKVTQHLSGKNITALIAALLFAIHPMNVEPVVWVSSLKDVLFTCFYLLSALFYLHYLETGFRPKYYIAAIVFFLASLLSKSAAVTLSVLLLAIDIYKARTINKRLLTEKIPFLLLSILFGIVNILSQSAVGAIHKDIAHYGFINRVFLLAYAIAQYIIRVIAPVNLSAAHYLPYMENGRLPFAYYLSIPFLLFVIWVVFRRSSFRKEMLFGFSFFLITISVMLQVVPVGAHLTAERYAYIPYIGLFYIVGQFVSFIDFKKWKNLVIPVSITVVIIFSFQTWGRIDIWRNDFTLFSSMIEKHPDIGHFYFTRGNWEIVNDKLQDALQDYNMTIQIDPQFEDSYYNRGKIYDALGNRQSAIIDYSKAIELTPMADVYNSRGWDYYKSGDNKSAMLDYDKAILLDTNFIKPYFNRATIKMNTGDFSNSIQDYSHILKVNPNDLDAYYFRGMAYLKMHDTSNACKDWNKAAELGNKYATDQLRQYCK